MEAKKKADELIKKFHDIDMVDNDGDTYWMERKNAIQCALICVNEILNECIEINTDKSLERFNFWQEVKAELKKQS